MTQGLLAIKIACLALIKSYISCAASQPKETSYRQSRGDECIPISKNTRHLNTDTLDQTADTLAEEVESHNGDKECPCGIDRHPWIGAGISADIAQHCTPFRNIRIVEGRTCYIQIGKSTTTNEYANKTQFSE